MRSVTVIFCLLICSSVSFSQKKQTIIQQNKRVEQVINSNWTFNYFPRESTPKSYEAFGFDDSRWTAISIPHTWRTYETTGELHPFIVNSAEDDNMYWWTGWGWYRKRFALSREYFGRKVFIEFDGVQKHCKVWLNGKYLGEHQGAYGAFDFDVTSIIKPEGSENVLAVAVNNFQEGSAPFMPDREGGYYEYGGIIRNVRLVLKDQLYIPMQGSAAYEGGTFVTTPVVNEKEAVVRVQTWVRNDYTVKKNCTLNTTILDAANKAVQVLSTQSAINPGQVFMFDQTFKPIRSPHLWSPDNPYLYTVKSKVIDANSAVDVYYSPLGIRSSKWDSNEKILTVNGKKIDLKGGNRRQDYPWLGAAVPEWLILMDCKYKDETEGYNFLRTIYNQDNRVVYEQADKAGIVIDAETYGINDRNSSPREIEQKVKEIIRSNRNHPSVMFWSFVNDAGFSTGSEFALAEDPSRQVLSGRDNPDATTSYFWYDPGNIKSPASSSVSGAARISLTGSHNKITADRGSVVIVTADLTDSNGNKIQGSKNNLKWIVSGPATLVGPVNYETGENSGKQISGEWYNGFTATNIVRSTGIPGKIKVTVFSSGIASGNFEIDAIPYKQDVSAFSEPLLSDDGRRPVARLIINLDRLDEVPKEIEYTQEPVTISVSDRESYLRSVRNYIFKNNTQSDTSSVEFRTLTEILAAQLQNNGGKMSAEDYNYNIDHFNNCRLIYSYITATKLPPLYKETLRKYYSESIITLGSEKNAGNEMNWLNWMPSGGTVVIVQDDNTKTGIKGVVYIKKESLSDIITTVYPQFASFSEDGKDRALTFIAKMNPHVQTTGSADGSGDVSYVAKKGEMLLIPLYKFISE
ncbi:MAG: hypothetical protein A2X05_12085 [Bacteroidetes bacterium GWE2_41_25]|nr:MAG: hypothetical protein A2X06_01685 [Bacteroidetes bacterium GWC2_40_22]OFX92161.1 MAG: hypothetical protein A2X05_12085 [Bacteroidetes bacterium GWE2_41_25]HAM10374.1 hypothetical protein [Bacteroidales bacterium]